MADQFTAGETFTEDEQVTASKLNLAQTNLKFTSNAVDGSTTEISSEAIIVKSGGLQRLSWQQTQSLKPRLAMAL